MMFPMDRDKLRAMYREAWAKHRDAAVMSPLESQIARVVSEHPEYQPDIESAGEEQAYQPEDGQTNPFLHMGMHLAIREQVATNRPPGINAIFSTLATRLGDPLAAEHAMMEALGQTLWEAQRNQSLPDDSAYLERLRRL